MYDADRDTYVEGGVVIFLTRAEGLEKMRKLVYKHSTNRLRNYEMENDLEQATGVAHVISEWCPFNGRFCTLAQPVPFPHPPISDYDQERGGEAGRPWRETTSRALRYKHYYVAGSHTLPVRIVQDYQGASDKDM